jgi:hypothetical protein
LLAALLLSMLGSACAAERPAVPGNADGASGGSGTRGGADQQVERPERPDVPSDPGIVKPPPKTGSARIKTPSPQVDPAIDDATGKIDERKRQEAQKSPP